MKKLYKILTAFALMLSAFTADIIAQPVYGNLPPLHVDGRFLRDEAGNKVVLHGVMDTPSQWFNGGRWGWGGYDYANAPTDCLNYFERVFKAITDNSQGAYSNIFRLHLDPCWTNGNVSTPAFPITQSDYLYGKEKPGGEADISKYSGTRLVKFLKSVYVPIAKKALNHGMYVIMRPPGVCPGDIQVGGYYQKYLLDVWDKVTQNADVLKYYGHISIELANEPVRIRNAQGQEWGDERFHDFFQPIVDKIRENGFKGIIWVPGGIWQQEYRPYANYPITDDLNNIGYAVHNYPGWYNNSDNNCVAANTIKAFGESIPMTTSNPIVITEVDWSPYKPGTGHYNESGAWVESNYGTWATASTSKWGKAYKALLDHYGNISMTLSGSDCYFDWNTYKNSGYKTVKPAFPGITEACGEACFEWYKEYAQVDYPSFELYQKEEVPENPFEFSETWFHPDLFLRKGSTASYTPNGIIYKAKLTIQSNGASGWRFEDEAGIDLSKYKSLTIECGRSTAANTFIVVYDNSNHMNYIGDRYEAQVGGTKKIVLDLENLETLKGNKIDLEHIRAVGLVNRDKDKQEISVKAVTLEPNGEVTPEPTFAEVTFSIDGVNDTKSLEVGSAITAPAVPEKTGYTFLSWNPELTEGAVVPEGGITYTAVWEVNKYKVTYIFNDMTIEEQEVAYGEEIPEYIFTPEDPRYSIVGWRSDEDYTTMPAKDIVFTADFEDYVSSAFAPIESKGIFTMAGIKVNSMKKGLNIVKMSDGTVKKIYIK